MTCTIASKKSRTFSEWFNDFLEADAAYYAEQFEADDWDLEHQSEHLPGVADDFFDDNADIDDGVLESLLIVGLAAALAFMVYYRQQRQQEARRQQDAAAAAAAGVAGQGPAGVPDAAAPEPNPGFFPPPGDPEFANWVAGGVGH